MKLIHQGIYSNVFHMIKLTVGISLSMAVDDDDKNFHPLAAPIGKSLARRESAVPGQSSRRLLIRC
jgi:hypothetical protein